MAHNLVKRGWHFLQIPGPSNTPDKVLKAMSSPTVDHRGPEFGAITLEILNNTRKIFQTSGDVVIYPSSGTGAWEAALVNLFQPGDKILTYESGHFSTLWKDLAEKIGLNIQEIASDWRRGAEADKIAQELDLDVHHQIDTPLV